MSHTDRLLPANGSVTDAESGTEIARLMHQDRLLTRSLGGILPEGIALAHQQAVLDLACGPGGWVLDVASQYPAVQVVGLDLSRTMVAYAQAQARAQGLDNAAFVVMDVTRPLDFPDASFDLVNARLLVGFMPTSAWLPLVRECLRLLRPGGILRLTECERSSSTSRALEELTALCTLALKLAGHSFSPDGRTLGITPLLGHFLRQMSCTHITQRAYALDYSADTPLYHSMMQNTSVASRLLQPFLCRMGVVTAERFEEVYRQMQIDLLADDFCALWFYLSVWGSKPHAAQEQESEMPR